MTKETYLIMLLRVIRNIKEEKTYKKFLKINIKQKTK